MLQSVVVDLHIEKIAKGYSRFTPSDAIIYQISHFDLSLAKYRGRRGQKIDFIHGSGAGVLRAELIKRLQTRYPGYKYEDAPFNLYGFQGAIRVTIL